MVAIIREADREHELIRARIQTEKQNNQSTAADDRGELDTETRN
jgi:hypothetical protein